MKKYIAWMLAMIVAVSSVFAYNMFKTPEQLLHDYVVSKCGVQGYGYSEVVNYENYKEIWDNICGFTSIDVPGEDATVFADLIVELSAELKK